MQASQPRIPLTGWADRQLAAFTELARLPPDAIPGGAALLGMRAALNGFAVPGSVSAGGGCRFYACRDGHVALNLSRPEDRDMLPALFCREDVDDIDACFARSSAPQLVAQGRILGLAIAHVRERASAEPVSCTATGPFRACGDTLRVIDLSALWAGPLASHMLQITGAKVVKVESRTRPDSMRAGDPALFAQLNQGKAELILDLKNAEERDQLIAMIRSADIVIEAARPRALLQLGLDADALVRETPGLVWLTITGHGPHNGIGFGDDTAVAGGLSSALFDATGKIGFVGDAIGDPLTGIFAALTALQHRQSGEAKRLILSMSAIVGRAISDEGEALQPQLRAWAEAEGQPLDDFVDQAPIQRHPGIDPPA